MLLTVPADPPVAGPDRALVLPPLGRPDVGALDVPTEEDTEALLLLLPRTTSITIATIKSRVIPTIMTLDLDVYIAMVYLTSVTAFA